MAFTKVVSVRSNVSRAVMLLLTYMIYVRDNVVQNAGHYRENKHWQGEPDPDAQRRCASP